MYDANPEFREFVQAKLKDGSLSQSNLLALVAASAKESDARTNEGVFLETFYNQ